MTYIPNDPSRKLKTNCAIFRLREAYKCSIEHLVYLRRSPLSSSHTLHSSSVYIYSYRHHKRILPYLNRISIN